MLIIFSVCYNSDAWSSCYVIFEIRSSLLKQNPHVCFECEQDVKVIPGDDACSWGTEYKSVIGFGRAQFVTDLADKERALNVIMNHYGDRSFKFSETDLKKVTIIRVDIDRMSGKQSPV